ncbi:hypothetical protein GCM10020254_49760 [Streptomyces goshikiensis]
MPAPAEAEPAGAAPDKAAPGVPAPAGAEPGTPASEEAAVAGGVVAVPGPAGRSGADGADADGRPGGEHLPAAPRATG